MTLTDRLPGTAEPDAIFDAFQSWVSGGALADVLPGEPPSE
ncbi:MAG: hypothetical protein QOC94_52 [Actinoplanes sp.]|jgi:hypothetical protein|nr:hypothetical protein [Actinoplanes sp.]